MIPAGLLAAAMLVQSFESRGMIENRTLFYPQEAANDPAHVVNETLLRWEVASKLTPWLTVSAALDARTDSHHETERSWAWDLDGRSIQRPAFSLRRLSATIHRGNWTGEFGRQFIRWGKADILNPTDRFAPKDYLSSVVDTEFLGVTAVRSTYERGGNTIDLVWQPLFTPSRTPLVNQRWTVLAPAASRVTLRDGGSQFPGGSQYGVRFNRVGTGYEYSLCYFDGRNSLPSFAVTARLPTVEFQRYYPKLRLYGGDAAIPLKWFIVKGEAAYFTSSTPNTEEYVIFVAQLERQVKEWSFVGGYAGEAVAKTTGNPLQFAPDRGVAKSFVGRAALTIDANRSLAVETAIRAAGSFARFEYSQAHGEHWRTTAGVAWIPGRRRGFPGPVSPQ